MNEYRIQRLKEELTYAQQRNKHQKEQLANYKKVHEKDLKEIEKLNNIINELEKYLKEQKEIWVNDVFDEVLNKLQELKGSDKE